MRYKEDFSDADPEETEEYTFNYARDLASDELLVSAVFTLTPVATFGDLSEDPAPSSRLAGGASIDATGKKATQRLTNLQPGNRYRLVCKGTTADGDTVSVYSFVTCRPLDD